MLEVEGFEFGEIELLEEAKDVNVFIEGHLGDG